MRQRRKSFIQRKGKLRRWSRRWRWRPILGLLLLCLTVRALPYLAPIHSSDIEQNQQAIEFTDRNGLALGTILTRNQENTAVVRLDGQVSDYFIHAIIAAEDQRYYQHGVLDMQAIARSLLEAMQAKQIVSGASTITMQLARMLDPSPRTIPNKIREVWLSWRLTAGMSKEEILEAYINRLPMGGNVYGVEAAARTYFGIPAADLNLAQATLLAAIPNDPTDLNPYSNWQGLKQRQAYVIDRLVADGYITRPEGDRAYAEKISLQPRDRGIIAAPHFLFFVAQQLPRQHPAVVITSIDRPLQQFVEAQVQQIIDNLAPNNVHNGAALVIDNHTGEVLAYVGSPDYNNAGKLGRNDGVQALRQPGSTLKPFLYELALKKRLIHPNTILADVPTHYPIPGAKLYSPLDYSETFHGPVRVRVALANSLNIPAVRVLERVGVENFFDRLHQLGFSHLDESPEYYGLGLALGSDEVNLWELARAYLTLARLGDAIWLSVIPVETSSNLNFDASPLGRSTMALITDMLSDAHARAIAFGVDSVLNLPFPAAVKTGTSSNYRDTWTLGFTRDYTVATWVGNFNGDRMQEVSGVTGAAPLWRRIMLHLHETSAPPAFPPPEHLVQQPICALSGLRPTPACPAVVQEYFYPEDLTEYFESSAALVLKDAARSRHDRHLDSFYQLVSDESDDLEYRIDLPPEYDEWVAMQHAPALFATDLKIVSPRNGDVFLLKPASRVEFKLAGIEDEAVEWWLNGKKLASGASNHLFWSLQPGNWTLQVKAGEKSDRVDFEVLLAEHRSTPRGFSIGN